MSKRRFFPGAMARLVRLNDKTLNGELVVIEEWLPPYGRWGVSLIARQVAGLTLDRRRFTVTSQCAVDESKLEPLGGEESLSLELDGEVSHG